MIENLSEGTTVVKVNEFISYLEEKYIPFYVGEMMKAGYQLVGMDESINNELKKSLKIKILGRGIGGI